MQNRHGSSSKSIASELGSILVFAISIFCLFALLTYWPSDPSLFSNAHGAARNACGRVGAFISSTLFECFGLGAFLFPAAMIFISAAIYKREGSVRLVGTLGGMSIAVMSFTVFLTLQWKYWPYAGTLLLTGGAFGAWFADVLIKQFNPLGSSIVSLGVFFISLALATPVSVAKWGYHLIDLVVFKGGRLVVTYLLYLVGLVAMRTAHTAGDLLQKLIEGAIRRAKERAKALAEARAAAAMSLPKPPEREVKEITVGPDVEPGLSDAIDLSAMRAHAEAQEASSSSLLAQPSEAPNVLPELEKKSENLSLVKESLRAPEILPPEASPGSSSLSASDPKLEKRIARAAKTKRGQWKLPTVEFLRRPPKIESQIDRDRLIQNSQILVQKFADFGIEGEVTAVRPGPVITLYEFKPGPGVKVSRIAALADDLSMALSAQSVRILAPLPGKSVVGIEIPSEQRETVYMREFLQHPDFYGSKHTIPVVMGKDIAGAPYLSDLARMPHLLCAGQTGAGKSVFMNGLICSLFYRFTPDELRMILVDPKFIEFRSYQDIPHLLLPVVDDARQASTALKWAVREMERRYRILAMVGARNLTAFNQKVEEMGADVIRDLLFSEENQPEGLAQMSGGDWVEAFEPDSDGAPRVGKLPYIVVIIDELADLMMIAKKEVEVSIARIAQKARAAGIHLVIATQRPSTDVITGLIKANLPSRVSFQLASYVDSKTILDRAGAERLLGQGDMLFIPPGVSQSVRLHGAFLDDEEIGKITSFLRSQGKPVYRDEILVDEEEDEDGIDGDEDADDELFREAVELVKRSGHASTSYLQRHLKVGYNRAARMIDAMESKGIVGPADGARPREVLLR